MYFVEYQKGIAMSTTIVALLALLTHKDTSNDVFLQRRYANFVKFFS